MRFSATSLLAASLSLVSAIHPPPISDLKLTWSESFSGCQGCYPDSDNWAVAVNTAFNNEHQTYTTSNTNIQLSGGDTLQLVPWKTDEGWTSGRIESHESFTPQPGKIMRIQSEFRLGDNARKQGMWPAFWMLGDAMRHGTPWPRCGELDIFEQINGEMTGHGTVHCGEACNEPQGLASQTTIPDNDFHSWSIVIDRTSGDWQTETITWLMDGNQFHQLKGSDLPDQGTWGILAHSPMYILLNVAVGGNWPVSLPLLYPTKHLLLTRPRDHQPTTPKTATAA